jgi:hypothetical protein
MTVTCASGWNTGSSINVSPYGYDLAGNSLSAGGSYSIHVPDSSTPTIYSITPNGGALASNTALVVQFSKAMSTGTVAPTVTSGACGQAISSTWGNTYLPQDTWVVTCASGWISESTFTLSITNAQDTTGQTVSSFTSPQFYGPDGTPPTVGSAITLSNRNAHSVTLTWGAASDNVSAPSNLYYKMVRASTLAAIDTVAEADAITTEALGLVMNWTQNTLSHTPTNLPLEIDSHFALLVRDENYNTNLYTPVSYPSYGRAPSHPFATLNDFATQGVSLPAAREHGAAVRVGTKVYLIGGTTTHTGAPVSSILEADYNPITGSIGSFSTSAYSLTTARKGHRVEVIGSWLYVFGGMSAAGQSSNPILNTAHVERAPIGPNGITGSFVNLSPTIQFASVGRYNFVSLITAGDNAGVPVAYLYVIGGGDNVTYHTNTIERATIDIATGNISTFTTYGATLVNAHWSFDGARYGSNFYIAGDDISQAIEVASIASDGTLSAFSNYNTLPVIRAALNMTPLYDQLYFFGGAANSGSWTWPSLMYQAAYSSSTLYGPAGSPRAMATGGELGMTLDTDFGVWVFGGFDGTAITNAIQYASFGLAPLNGDFEATPNPAGSWARVSDVWNNGTYSYRSSPGMGDNANSCFSTTVDLTYSDARTLRYFGKVDSEANCDFLKIFIDGNEFVPARYSGPGQPWQEFRVPLAGGSVRTLQWCYTKDVSVTFGTDAAWVDDIVVLP